MPIGAIIVAGGRGERMGARVPKPLLDLGGRTILQRSVSAFAHHPDVSELVVVLPDELVAQGASLVGPTPCACRFVGGGERRQDSVARGLAAMPAGIDLVLVHDAARPFASHAVIDRVIAGARETGAALPAVPASDTLKRVVRETGLVRETVARDDVWHAQTPQGFRRPVLEAAMAAGGAGVTDEASLVERLGQPVRVVPGDPGNMKITTPEDLETARARVAAAPRVGTGYDLHRLAAGRRLVLAGVVLPFDRGPQSHSDGDVLCHALTDAILGGAGAGDIGAHFPDTDARWKDAQGLDLLGRAVAIAGGLGFRVASADATVVLERPKLAPLVPAIRERLAVVLGIPVEAVSVKAKTNEGVDAVGRGEAIAAHAVAVLVRGGA